MDLFCFASKNVENIRRGIEARKWAVATVSTSAMKGRITKAQRYFHSGSLGLLYCRETHFFTTPFIATSSADPREVVKDIWPEPWVLPFSIKPLGNLEKRVPGDLAKFRWRILKNCGLGGVTAAMNATGATVFSPVKITEEDWKIILEDLATEPPQSN